MATPTGTEMLIAGSISIISIILSIFLIRMVANLLLLLAFAVAVAAPIAWYMQELANGSQMPVLAMYVAAVIFAFVITLMTTPLWQVSSMMQWTGKPERKRLDKVEETTQSLRKTERKDPVIHSPEI
jgi:type VI protein secretion system component VasK